jgi:hypothetical protein
MRLGHNSSSSPEEGFEPTIDVQVSLMAVQERQLVDQHRSQSETLGVDPTLGGNLPVIIYDRPSVEGRRIATSCYKAKKQEDRGMMPRLYTHPMQMPTKPV